MTNFHIKCAVISTLNYQSHKNWVMVLKFPFIIVLSPFATSSFNSHHFIFSTLPLAHNKNKIILTYSHIHTEGVFTSLPFFSFTHFALSSTIALLCEVFSHIYKSKQKIPFKCKGWVTCSVLKNLFI